MENRDANDPLPRTAHWWFAGFVVLAIIAFPFVRDIALFERVYAWMCAPFQ